MDEKYLEFCKTPYQETLLKTYLGEGNQDPEITAGLLDKTKNAVSKTLGQIRTQARIQGYSPEHNLLHPVPEPQYVKGVSTMVKTPEGLPQWVKSDTRQADLERFVLESIESFTRDLPRMPATPINRMADFSKDLCAVYPMGDPHLGMLAWAEESDEDFNLDTCVKNLCKAVDYLVRMAPPCQEALLINLGDFFHADNSASRSRSGNVLDTSDVYSRVVDLGLSAIRQAITSLLMHHAKVTVISAIGNHDEHSALWLMKALAHIYENDPRVTVIDKPRLKHYYRWGKCLFGVHHGHTLKKEKLPIHMASDCAENYWHKTKHRVWFTGHIHHETVTEDASSGVVIKSYRTLAPKDRWHTDMGYKSARDMNVEMYHREHGLVGTNKVSVTMLS